MRLAQKRVLHGKWKKSGRYTETIYTLLVMKREKSMEKESREGIISSLDTKTKFLGLSALILEATFLASLKILPEKQYFRI